MGTTFSLNVALIEQHLRSTAKSCRVAVFPSLASTNATAKQMAAQGAQNGSVVIAERQSEGRGRLGRSFFSPDGTGVYMSVIVRGSLQVTDATRLTTAAAVATAQAIEVVSDRTAGIKWVNDIYLNGKKVCGILTEGGICSGKGQLDYAVIGIGINVAPPKGGFPDEIADIAAAIFADANAANGMREDLIAEILNHLMPLLENLTSPNILCEYRRRSTIVGQRVYVHRADSPARAALALEIDNDFRLLVRYEDGTTEALDSGEVSIRNI